MDSLTSIEIQQFQSKILAWYNIHARDLPRRHTHNPYHILISEIMSHQTQISRVVTYRTTWVAQLPTIHDVAQLDTAGLLQLRQGLGYNNRALRLRETCRIISTQYQGIIPSDPSLLMQLPGIGRYTAHAIASFAYNLPYPVLDTNIKRVWFHHFPQTLEIKESDLIEFASQFIPSDQSQLWHSALMDYGAIELPMHRSNIRINAKQSSFRGSTRRVRSHIIKHILAHGPTDQHTLYDLYAKPREYNLDQYHAIVSKMISNHLIAIKDALLYIAH